MFIASAPGLFFSYHTSNFGQTQGHNTSKPNLPLSHITKRKLSGRSLFYAWIIQRVLRERDSKTEITVK